MIFMESHKQFNNKKQLTIANKKFHHGQENNFFYLPELTFFNNFDSDKNYERKNDFQLWKKNQEPSVYYL